MSVTLHRCLRVAIFLVVVALLGCTGDNSASSTEDIKCELSVEPKPPKVGDAKATIGLTDKDGKPVTGAKVKLEGNMNHAGMKPVFADAKEVDPGKYRATLELTMGGDWFVLVNATLADGRKLKRKLDLHGVKSE